MGVGHAWVDPYGLAIRLDCHVFLTLAPMHQAQVVIAFSAMGVELQTAAQHVNGFIKPVEQI